MNIILWDATLLATNIVSSYSITWLCGQSKIKLKINSAV